MVEILGSVCAAIGDYVVVVVTKGGDLLCALIGR